MAGKDEGRFSMIREFVYYDQGRERKIVIDLADTEQTPSLVDDAMSVSSQMGTIGALIGQYIRELAMAKAEFKHWKGKRAQEVREERGKVTAGEVDDIVESDKQFLAFAEEEADLEGDLECLRRFMDSMGTKGQVVKIRKDLAIKELDGSLHGLGAGGSGRIPARERTRVEAGSKKVSA